MNSSLVRRMAWRDWRSGELRLLVVSLILAVTTVSGIGLFVDRLQQALTTESADFLAADLQVQAAMPIPESIETAANLLGLASARMLVFQSMVFGSDDRSQLASIKAVTPGYPLRGTLRTALEPFVPGLQTDELPAPGEIWVDARLLTSLNLAPGDELEVGYGVFRISRVLIAEPDGGGSLFDLGPRVLMRMTDVAATRVVQPGSRISYRLLLSGSASDLARLKSNFTLPPAFRWVSIRESSPSIGAALERGENYLLLGGLLAVLLAAVALTLSARRYAARHYDHVAVLKTLGATPNKVFITYLGVLLLVAAIAILVGLFCGGLLHWIILALLQSLFSLNLPAPGWEPLMLGAVTGLICVMCFALPPFIALRSIAPLRVFRHELDQKPLSHLLSYLAALAGVVLLLWWYSDSWWLTGIILLGVSVVLLIFGSGALLLLGGSRIVGMQARGGWRLALAGLRRRRLENIGQMLVFGVAIMLMLLIVLLRTSLLEQWQAQVPENAPNHFVLNLLPDEVEQFRTELAAIGALAEPGYAMIRGRIVSVNGVEARQHQAMVQTPGQGPGVDLDSQRNLTWSLLLPPDNEIIAGQWWQPSEKRHLVSLEEGYALGLGLNIGDELQFDIAGTLVNAQVSNIRRLAWESLRPNFFVLFSPAVLKGFATTYMTSFYLSVDRKPRLAQLLKDHPTITLIEVDALIAQVQGIINKVSQAVQLVLYLVVIAACLVLVASIQASRDTRMNEHALLRALGGSTQLIRGALLGEFAMLGGAAGLLAAFGAELILAALQRQVFLLPIVPHPMVWIVGPLLGASLVVVVGLVSTRKLVSAPPIAVLRGLE